MVAARHDHLGVPGRRHNLLYPLVHPAEVGVSAIPVDAPKLRTIEAQPCSQPCNGSPHLPVCDESTATAACRRSHVERPPDTTGDISKSQQGSRTRGTHDRRRSQGGTAAITLAEFHPQRYRFAGSLSGFLTPGSTTMMVPSLPAWNASAAWTPETSGGSRSWVAGSGTIRTRTSSS
jgi:hypothetical protein